MPSLRFIEPLSDRAATMNLTASGQKNVAGASIIPAIGLLVLGWPKLMKALVDERSHCGREGQVRGCEKYPPPEPRSNYAGASNAELRADVIGKHGIDAGI